MLAYRNADGGFGNGLEPDKLAPESQPLDVFFALQTLHEAGAREPEVGRRACDFLATVADDRGLVPMVLPSVLRYPRANHWNSVELKAEVGPAVGIAGYLHELGVEHPWLELVTRTCFEEIERAPVEDAHQLHEAIPFARYAPGGEALLPRLAEALANARWFLADPADTSYGLPPTKFPREWFDDAVFEAHLDRLEAKQQEDGGWTIAWEPPGPASVEAWRAIATIEALQTLKAHDRLDR